jgi:hypothetical protein
VEDIDKSKMNPLYIHNYWFPLHHSALRQTQYKTPHTAEFLQTPAETDTPTPLTPFFISSHHLYCITLHLNHMVTEGVQIMWFFFLPTTCIKRCMEHLFSDLERCGQSNTICVQFRQNRQNLDNLSFLTEKSFATNSWCICNKFVTL